MSVYYSRFLLNTYAATAYFQAHVPPDYPLGLVLQGARAFRRLPPRLRELSALAKRWSARTSAGGYNEADMWYDAAGNELDPNTGAPLTDAEVDAQWPASISALMAFVVEDVPLPHGGFSDPDTWVEPITPPVADDDAGITEAQLMRDMKSHGREYVARDAGISAADARRVSSDRQLARMILGAPHPPNAAPVTPHTAAPPLLPPPPG